MLVSIAEKDDDEPEDEEESPEVEESLLDELDDDATLEVEPDDPPSIGGGGGGGMFAFMKLDSSACDTEPSPSVSIAERRSLAEVDDDEEVEELLEVDELDEVDDESRKAESSLVDTEPSPSVSSEENSLDAGSKAELVDEVDEFMQGHHRDHALHVAAIGAKREPDGVDLAVSSIGQHAADHGCEYRCPRFTNLGEDLLDPSPGFVFSRLAAVIAAEVGAKDVGHLPAHVEDAEAAFGQEFDRRRGGTALAECLR